MASAFQENAFQNDAFQTGSPVDVGGSGCATARAMNRADISARSGNRATLSVESVNGIAINATARDCC